MKKRQKKKKNQEIENKMNEKVQQIEGEIKLSEEKVDKLNSNNQEYQDQIEK